MSHYDVVTGRYFYWLNYSEGVLVAKDKFVLVIDFIWICKKYGKNHQLSRKYIVNNTFKK